LDRWQLLGNEVIWVKWPSRWWWWGSSR
jgi:hypothetical protein